MKYRSRTEIVCNILDATNGGGATKTKIMYKAFLSYTQLKEYLSVLTENNLIEYSNGTHSRLQKKDSTILKCIMKLENYYNKLLQSK
jgi:predicted transcriptional regulator